MRQTTIAFLGQCHTTGYPGVPPAGTFPEIARRAIEAARPSSRVRVIAEPFYHPADLPRAAERVVARRPRVVVVEVIGWVAVSGAQSVDLSRLPRGIRSAYDRIRHFRHIAARVRERWPLASGLISRAETNVAALASGPLRSLVPRLPRPTVLDYETALEEAARRLTRVAGIDVVIEGPGAFSDRIDARRVAPDAPEIYRGVNDLARRVAGRHGFLFVERLDAAGLPLRVFYQDGSIRPSCAGHAAWGNILADNLLRAGIA